ncbi:hypothetical protein [Atrimonas thermophila]|uniref:hypothetical protein n=1 Tax=Atrimonas thermophila TaxID=3064161 RepID=UPI00399C5632
MAVLKERVDKLEEALMRLVYIQQKTEIELQEFKKEMQEFKREMQDFKDEMKDFKDEMKAFKDEMKDFKDEMKDFKDEMKAFKDEMKDFKDEMKAFKDEMKDFKDEMLDFKEWSKRNIENLNQQWGKLANRLGTLVEDIFAPSIGQAIEKYFGVSPDVIDTKKLVRKEGKSLEVDILALCEKEKVAYVVEVKANPDRKEYIEDFLKKLKEIPSFLPSLGGYTLQGIYAGLNMKEETVKLLTRKKLYAMVFRGDILEIVNFEDVRK